MDADEKIEWSKILKSAYKYDDKLHRYIRWWLKRQMKN